MGGGEFSLKESEFSKGLIRALLLHIHVASHKHVLKLYKE